MAGQVFVVVYCATTGRPMTGRFIEQEDSWKLAELHLREGEGVAQTPEAPELLEGNFDVASEFTGCPECANPSFVRCGACGELSCWPGGTGHFSCTACGRDDEVVVAPVVDVRVDDFG